MFLMKRNLFLAAVALVVGGVAVGLKRASASAGQQSPTCHYCQSGYKVVKALFDGNKEPRLKGLVVWLPMLSQDTADAASAEAKSFADTRLVQGWDDQKQIGAAFSKTLALTGTAWDVYLIYPAGVEWTGDVPPKPQFWMHQLKEEKSGADPKLCLNVPYFTAQLNAQIALLTDHEVEAGPKDISVAELARRLNEKDLFVYDVNGEKLFRQGHVRGARRVLHDDITTATLPENKAAALVFYCTEGCGSSRGVAKDAMKRGYKNVYFMPAGIDGWTAAAMPTITGDVDKVL
jgi:rhodanese-related sulfurtransferase